MPLENCNLHFWAAIRRLRCRCDRPSRLLSADHLCQLEGYSYHGDLVHGVSILSSWFELNRLCDCLRLLIKTMAKAAQHLQNLDVTICRKPHFKLYVAFNT